MLNDAASFEQWGVSVKPPLRDGDLCDYGVLASS